MSEEMKDNRSPQEEAQPQKQEEEKKTPVQRKNSVFQYLSVLFGAAFLLLLLTFAMERRQNALLLEQNAQEIDNLQNQSVSAVQSLENLYAQNDALREKVAQLEQALEQAKTESQTQAALKAEQTEKTLAAMDWFWQLDEAFVRNQKSLCRRIIRTMEEAALVDYLPTESVTNNGRFSPADRYQEIYEALF